MVPMTPVLTQAVGIITEPRFSRTMDPDMPFGSSSGLEITVAPIDSAGYPDSTSDPDQ